MSLVRLSLFRTSAGVSSLLPLRWISRWLKPSARARLWRFLALFVARRHGMRRSRSRASGSAPSGGCFDLLLVSDALFPERGGGTRSLMQVARRLVAAGRKVAGVCQGPERRRFTVGGIEIHWIPDAAELAGFMRATPARRVVVQQAWAPVAAEAARAAGLPYWYFARSTEEFIEESGDAFDEVQLATAIRAATDARALATSAVVAGAERVVANSRFMARLMRGAFGREADVLYPEVDEPMPWEKRRDPIARGILAVATTNKKGVGIMFELAKAFPREQFLLCGFKPLTRYRNMLLDERTVRNIVPLGRLPTPATYALAKLVLVPSQWPEPFGRVNAEALLRGIPVLASRVGGIPEIVTDESLLIADFKNPEAWAERLRNLRRPSALRAVRPAVVESAATYSRLLGENEALIGHLVR